MTPSPGAGYLQKQRFRLAVEKDLIDWVRSIINVFEDDLRRRASAFRERRVQFTSNTENERETIINWSFLVRRAAVAGFQARIDEANAQHCARGLTFDISGPWPPYSFSPSLAAEVDP